ncbi:hypothetical protein KND99_000290 [Staphylococcus pseudintermedius]|nr:hypothetical protein [Staphylococcus pseudintermedius]
MDKDTKFYKTHNSFNLRNEHFERMVKLSKLHNQNRKAFAPELRDSVTFKEAEIIFKLPPNTITRDYSRGLVNPNRVRKSVGVWLISLREAKKLYESYWNRRARENKSHLYSSLDGIKMSEIEYYVRRGIEKEEDNEN